MSKTKEDGPMSFNGLVDGLSENHAKFVIKMLVAGNKTSESSVIDAMVYAKNHIEW